MNIRINKFIAQAGICSRRKADELIRNGQIKLNGKMVRELGTMVDLENDQVFCNNQPIGLNNGKEFIILNKPVGYTCTHRSFKGEKNIFELLPKKYSNLFCIGRLDKNSRGLVLLTNNGELAQELSHPSHNHEKEYVVQIDKEINQLQIKKLRKGLELPGLGFVNMKSVEKQRHTQDKPGLSFVLRIILTQGKKRQIREMLKYLDFKVLDLKRVRVDKINLGSLTEGKWKNINY